jgi:hypothetical protein
MTARVKGRKGDAEERDQKWLGSRMDTGARVDTRQRAWRQHSSGVYKNCTIAGVEIDKADQVYVSVPSWKPGVPTTLNKVHTRTAPWGHPPLPRSRFPYAVRGQVVGVGMEARLQPFPSWDMNAVGTPGDQHHPTLPSRSFAWFADVTDGANTAYTYTRTTFTNRVCLS